MASKALQLRPIRVPGIIPSNKEQQTITLCLCMHASVLVHLYSKMKLKEVVLDPRMPTTPWWPAIGLSDLYFCVGTV